MDEWKAQEAAALEVARPAFKAGDTEAAIRGLKALIAESGDDAARVVAQLNFTTSPSDMRDWLSRAAEVVHGKSGEVESYYVEMNGFAINWDRWFAMLMGTALLTRDKPHAYLESGPEVGAGVLLTLEGSGDAQAAYEHASQRGTAFHAAADYLVHASFVDLVRRAWEQGPIDHVSGSLVVTTHAMGPVLFLERHAA